VRASSGHASEDPTELELPSGKTGFASGQIPPPAALAEADELLLSLRGNPDMVGSSNVVEGWWIETHTLGCRSDSGEEGDEAWNTHWELFDSYANDGISAVFGDAVDGYFVTLTPQRSE
jgi:hypothetical protein